MTANTSSVARWEIYFLGFSRQPREHDPARVHIIVGMDQPVVLDGPGTTRRQPLRTWWRNINGEAWTAEDVSRRIAPCPFNMTWDLRIDGIGEDGSKVSSWILTGCRWTGGHLDEDDPTMMMIETSMDRVSMADHR
jgi:hypothetical protein